MSVKEQAFIHWFGQEAASIVKFEADPNGFLSLAVPNM